jgi:hypothetical protein
MWFTCVWRGEEGSTPKAARITRWKDRVFSQIPISTYPALPPLGHEATPFEFLTRPWLESQVWC